jgi:hypothetical protein
MTRLTRLLSPFLVAALAACASGSGSGPVRAARPVPELSVPGLHGTLDPNSEVPSSTTQLAAAPDSVWNALVKVYAGLGLPVTGIDTGARVLDSVDQRLRSVGGRRLTDLVDCGGSYGSASTYDIYLTVRTQLKAGESGGTLSSTQVTASAKPPTGSSRIQCSSSGGLEQMIAARLREALGAPSAG